MKEGPYELYLECGHNGPVIEVQATAEYDEVATFIGQVSLGQVSGTTDGENKYDLWREYKANNNPTVGNMIYVGNRTKNVWAVAVEGRSFVAVKDENVWEFAGVILQGNAIA
jgi:hypothetical protein